MQLPFFSAFALAREIQHNSRCYADVRVEIKVTTETYSDLIFKLKHYKILIILQANCIFVFDLNKLSKFISIDKRAQFTYKLKAQSTRTRNQKNNV